MNRKKKTAVIIAAALMAAGVLGVQMYTSRRAEKSMAENSGQVETTPVSRQNLIESISVTGTIASADARDVQASARDVEVLQVNYEVGDYVNAGDVILVLDSSELELGLTQAQNNQALSEYKENKSIETASVDYAEAVEDGTDDYAKALKKEAEAKEDLQEAGGDLEDAAKRLKSQEERAEAAQKTYDESGSEEDKKALENARAEYTLRHQAYTAAEEAEKKAQEAYEAAVENLEEAGKKNDRNISSASDSLERAQMEHTYSNDSSQKTIENYQEQIESCTVTAPISGVITAMNVEVGDTYQGEGNTLFSVADNERFVVSASVDEYDIGSIHKEMEAAVIVEALGDGELPAKVSFVSPTASGSDMGNSSYSIEIALDDINEDLRIGMTAKASIVLDAAYDVLTVPYDCIVEDEDGNSFLYVRRDGERTELPVVVGMQGDYYVEVSGEGVEEGMEVYYTIPMADSALPGSSDENVFMTPGNPGGGPRGGGAPRGGPGGF